jgi:hypothetical protein
MKINKKKNFIIKLTEHLQSNKIMLTIFIRVRAFYRKYKNQKRENVDLLHSKKHNLDLLV